MRLFLFLMLSPFFVLAQSKNDSIKKINFLQKADLLLQKLDSDKPKNKTPISIFPMPSISYNPLGGLNFGAFLFLNVENTKNRDKKYSKFNTNKSVYDISVSYSLNKQFVTYFKPKLFFINNRLFLDGLLEYANISLPFWGIGGNTPEKNKEYFTQNTYKIKANLAWEFTPYFFAGGGYRFYSYKTTKLKDGGILDTQDILGKNKSDISAFALMASFDSRDDYFSAHRGSFISLELSCSNKAFGSDFNFLKHYIDLRHYMNFAEHQVLSINLYQEQSVGNVPFTDMSKLGGSFYSRGIIEGRYIDKALACFQTEYKYYFERISLAAFLSFANVGETLAEAWLMDKIAYGVGVRFRIFKKTRLYLRFDVASNPIDNKLYYYFALNEFF